MKDLTSCNLLLSNPFPLQYSSITFFCLLHDKPLPLHQCIPETRTSFLLPSTHSLFNLLQSIHRLANQLNQIPKQAHINPCTFSFHCTRTPASQIYSDNLSRSSLKTPQAFPIEPCATGQTLQSAFASGAFKHLLLCTDPEVISQC